MTSPQSAALQRGLFVAFEGGDGAGKTTQVTALRDWLTEQGYDVLVTRQPGGTDLGRAIRDLVLHGEHVSPRAEALLFAADKAHHADTLVRPALDAGRMVITDRYTPIPPSPTRAPVETWGSPRSPGCSTGLSRTCCPT